MSPLIADLYPEKEEAIATPADTFEPSQAPSQPEVAIADAPTEHVEQDDGEINIMGMLYKRMFISAGISGVAFLIATLITFIGFDFSGILGVGNVFTIFLCSLIGIGVTIGIMFITEYYTSTNFRPVKKIAKASETGSATNIISGLGPSEWKVPLTPSSC